LTTPTAQDIIDASDLDFSQVGDQGRFADAAGLQPIVDTAVGWIEWATGQTYAAMPTAFEAMALTAAQRLTEIMAVQSATDIVEAQADYATIQSFSAGGYNETRRSLDAVRKSGMIHVDPVMHALLWAMLTDDKRDDWTFWLTGEVAPASNVTEVDWTLDSFTFGGGDWPRSAW
jgi:hypothetical protein